MVRWPCEAVDRKPVPTRWRAAPTLIPEPARPFSSAAAGKETFREEVQNIATGLPHPGRLTRFRAQTTLAYWQIHTGSGRAISSVWLEH